MRTIVNVGKYLLFPFFLVLVLSSCKKKSHIVGSKSHPDLLYHPHSFSLSADSGTSKLYINNNGDATLNWKVSSESKWLTLSPTSGTDKDSVLISYEKNINNNVRKTWIKLTSNGGDTLLPVNQQVAAAPVLSVSPSYFLIGQKGGSEKFMIMNSGDQNLHWKVNNTAGWLTVSPDSGSDHQTVIINCKMNSSNNERQAQIEVSSNGGNSTISISQSGENKPVLGYKPSSFEVGPQAGTAILNIGNTGGDTLKWRVSSNANWLSFNPYNGNNEHKVVVYFKKNINGLSRKSNIIINSNGGNDSVSIQQIGFPILSFNPSSLNLDSKAGVKKIYIYNKGGDTLHWQVKNDYKWLSINHGSGINNDSLFIDYKSNTTNNIRLAQILIVSDGGNGTLNIRQSVSNPKIKRFKTNNDSLNTSGGEILLSWNGEHVHNFTINSTPTIDGFPILTNKDSIKVQIPPNKTPLKKIYLFTLIAKGFSGTVPVSDSLTISVNSMVKVYSGRNKYAFVAPTGIAIDEVNNIWISDSDYFSITKLPSSNRSEPKIFDGYTYNFSYPRGIAIDKSDNVWIANWNNNNVVEIPHLDPTNPKFYSGGKYGFINPWGIAIDNSGNVWVTNSGGNSVSELPVNNRSNPIIYQNQFFSIHSYNSPKGIAVDDSGNVWIANSGSDIISEIPRTSQSNIKTYKGSIYKFNDPKDIAIDKVGNVWITNSDGNSITELPSKNRTNPIVYEGSNYEFYSPWGIAIDGDGNVWVANANMKGNSITELPASNRNHPVVFKGSLYGLSYPRYLAIDDSGNVWITNIGNSVTELKGIAAPLPFSVPLGQ